MMRRLLDRGRWLLLGVLGATSVAVVVAQEPQMFNRGIVINSDGGLTVNRGATRPTSGLLPYYDNQILSGGVFDRDVTYSPDNIRYGLVTRDTITSNRTDALPTAAQLVAEFPAARVGSTLFFMLDNQDSAQTITLNGASTGVTYAGGCGTALAATEAAMVAIVFTNVTSGSEAVRAVCFVN